MTEKHTPLTDRSAPTAAADPHKTVTTTDDQSPEALRRRFLTRFGGYALTVPLVTFTLMSPRTSKAVGSNTDDGPT